MIFIKSTCYKRIWVKCKPSCTFLKNAERREVQLTCVACLHCDSIELEIYLYIPLLFRQRSTHKCICLLIVICLNAVEISRVLGLESPGCFRDSWGAWLWTHSWEICYLLENHMRNKSFQVDRSAKAHFSLDGCLPLWRLVWGMFVWKQISIISESLAERRNLKSHSYWHLVSLHRISANWLSGYVGTPPMMGNSPLLDVAYFILN